MSKQAYIDNLGEYLLQTYMMSDLRLLYLCGNLSQDMSTSVVKMLLCT